MEEKYTKHYFKRLSLEIGNYCDGFQFIEIKNKDNKLVIEYTPNKHTSKKQFSLNMNISYEFFLETF
ncbi:hypothetical protein Holit_02109 [Hollandina sp. SP2]